MKSAVPVGLSTVAALMFAALTFLGGWYLRGIRETSAANARTRALFDEAWSHVRDNFVGELPGDTQRDYGAIRGALATLNDRYTYFVEPRNRAIERDHMRGQFGGIGVTFIVNKAGQIVLTARKGGAAEKAGVKTNDILISIDDVALPKPAKQDDVLSLRGEPGSTVKIGVLRGTQALSFTITRELIQVASMEWKVITTATDNPTKTIGYIHIRQFTERTGEEMKQAMSDLRSQNIQAWLIDLRDNGGGVLSAAVDVASEFLDGGNVLIEQKRNAPEAAYSVRDSQADKALLAVLINKNSASASEVVAGAIQDRQRGKIIGEKSFGKGSVQLIFDLKDGSSVHVTTSKWLTPNRRLIDGDGLTPDVAVVRAEGEEGRGVDSQLDAAINWLATQTGGK
jgi:carboxyl-terminal processing protease